MINRTDNGPDEGHPEVAPRYEENWLPVVDWEGLYEVSDLGRVRSLDREELCRGVVRSRKGRIMHPKPNKGGYLRVALSRDGQRQMHSVHRLVLEAFVGPCPPGEEGCHGPNGVSDNSLSNLSWGTKEKNYGEDKRRDGTLPLGEKHHQAKLTWPQVREIKERLVAGDSHAVIAADYDVSSPMITRINRGVGWKDEDDPYSALIGTVA